MAERRQAVFSADKSADGDEIQRRLYDLQRYSAAHMNADTGDIYLDKKYNRDVEQLVEQAKQEESDGNDIFKKADAACKPLFSGYTQAYVQCVADEQAKYPSGSDPINEISMPNPALYKHSFVSPLWSPDFAGWSLVVSLVLALLIIARMIVKAILLAMLKRHYRQI